MKRRSRLPELICRAFGCDSRYVDYVILGNSMSALYRCRRCKQDEIRTISMPVGLSLHKGRF